MNFKLTMVLVIVLGLLGSLLFFLPAKKPADVAADGSTPLLAPAPKEIKSLEYWRSGAEQFAFEKTADGWRMTYPVKAKADEYAVGSLSAFLLTEGYKEKLEPGNTHMVTPDVAGTDKPKYIVKFTDDAGKQYSLALGKRTVSGIYASFNATPAIYLLDASHNPLDQLEKEPGDFRDKNIASAESPNQKIVGLIIKHPDQTVRLRKLQGKWEIESPFPARADASVADTIAGEMKSIKATGFTDMAKDLAGLTTPVVTITAQIEETPPPAHAATQSSQPAVKKSELTLELGYYQDPTSKQAVYATLPGTPDVFILGGDVFKKLNKELNDLRDPAVMPVDVTAATQVSIQPLAMSLESSVTVKKEGSRWIMPNLKSPLPAGNAEVLKLFTDIRDLRAIKFVDNAGDLKSIGLDPPQITIAITMPGKKDPEELLIGKPETADKVTPVMRKGEPTVYLVQSADIQKMLPAAIAMRDKTVESLVSDNIRSFTISGKESASNGITLQRAGSAWKLKKSEKITSADDSAITSLLSDFTPLMATRYLAASDDLPNKGQLAATVTVQGALTSPATSPATAPALLPEILYTHTLKLFKNSEGKWSALWDGGKDPWIFEPTPDLIKQIMQTTYAAPTTQPAASPTQ